MRHVIPEKVVVIGAGLAGLRAVQQLRRQGFGGSITMVGDEASAPYDRPPLSKQVLTGEWDEARTALVTDEVLAGLDVDLRLGTSGTGLGIWQVQLADGSLLPTDATIIATGAVPRTLPGQPEGVGVLRTLEDSRELKTRLEQISSLLIVGGGLLAAEVATAAKTAGISVTVLEAQEHPCLRAFGATAAGLVARLYREADVDLRTAAEVTSFADATTVQLSDGEQLTADHVLVAIGSEPNIAWLADSDIPTGDGILAGGTGRVPPLPEVWALGDSTSWWDQPRRGYSRTEHWTAAGEQAAMVAADILGLDTPALAPPYVWSEQFGTVIELLGRTDISDEVVTLHGSGLDGGPIAGTVLGYRREGHLVAVVSFGDDKAVERYREEVVDGTTAITTVAEEMED